MAKFHQQFFFDWYTSEALLCDLVGKGMIYVIFVESIIIHSTILGFKHIAHNKMAISYSWCYWNQTSMSSPRPCFFTNIFVFGSHCVIVKNLKLRIIYNINVFHTHYISITCLQWQTWVNSSLLVVLVFHYSNTLL